MVQIRKKLEVALLTPHKFTVPYKTAKNPENIDKIRIIRYKINIMTVYFQKKMLCGEKQLFGASSNAKVRVFIYLVTQECIHKGSSAKINYVNIL